MLSQLLTYVFGRHMLGQNRKVLLSILCNKKPATIWDLTPRYIINDLMSCVFLCYSSKQAEWLKTLELSTEFFPYCLKLFLLPLFCFVFFFFKIYFISIFVNYFRQFCIIFFSFLVIVYLFILSSIVIDWVSILLKLLSKTTKKATKK